MGRGVSSGGGQSSLGYLFGSGEAPNKAQGSSPPVKTQDQPADGGRPQPADSGRPQNLCVSSPPVNKEIPAGIPGNLTNNYHRADGQNCGNFLTVRPSTLSSFLKLRNSRIPISKAL